MRKRTAVISLGATLLAGAGVLLKGGCGGPCDGVYHCPAAIIAQVDLPAGVNGPLASVTADAPCTAAHLEGDAGAPLLVSINGSIAPGTTKTCLVHGKLSDGSELVASVTYRPLGECCSGLSTAVDSLVTFSRVDGGTGDATQGN